MGPLAAGIGAAATLGGAFMSAQGAAAQNAAARDRMNMEYSMFQRQNDLNQWYFQKNFENELYLTGSAYQRAMADMKAAGLNPVLAYQQGGAGGHAGSGQSAGGQLSDPMPANPAGELGRGIGRTVQSALDAAHTVETVGLTANQKETERQRARNVELDNALKIEQTFRTAAEIDKVKSETSLTQGQTSHLSHVQKYLGAQSAQALANAGNVSAQTPGSAAASAKAQDFGPGWVGDIANTADKIRQHGQRKIGEGWDAAKDVARRVWSSVGGLGQPTTPVPNPRR